MSEETEKARGFEIDAKKLGLEGRELLGEMKAVVRWVAMFGSMRERSSDVQERAFLAEVCAALQDDAERLKVEIIRLAVARGAGREIGETKPSTDGEKVH